MKRQPIRIAVITGDHGLPDPSKPGVRYGDEDFKIHKAMVDAFGCFSWAKTDIWTDHDGFLDWLQREKPALVVNFCDTGYRNIAANELVLPSYLDMLGIPYTGAPPAAMVLTYDKQMVRLVAEAMGIATPREVFLPGGHDDALPGFYPALIKPNRADGSLGITKDAVVHNESEARAYLTWLRETLPGADVLYQEYLSGTEYGIGLIGNPETELTALPAMQVDFSKLPLGLAPILSYESKSLPDSPYWTEITFAHASLPESTEARLVADCKRLFKRFGLRDYGRFDFRCDADGVPKLMEINANPAWGNDGKLCFMAGFAGIEYPAMLEMIVETALKRIGLK